MKRLAHVASKDPDPSARTAAIIALSSTLHTIPSLIPVIRNDVDIVEINKFIQLTTNSTSLNSSTSSPSTLSTSESTSTSPSPSSSAPLSANLLSSRGSHLLLLLR